MKFLLRSLLVLAVAVAFGVVLYYAVQALPGGSKPNPSRVNTRPEGAKNVPQNPASRPERPENRVGFRWRSVLQVTRRAIVFSLLVFISVLAKDFIFKRGPNRRG
jgi:hypothetical protein